MTGKQAQNEPIIPATNVVPGNTPPEETPDTLNQENQDQQEEDLSPELKEFLQSVMGESAESYDEPVFKLDNDEAGIIGPMKQFPEIATPLNHLAQVLLVDPLPNVTLTRVQREGLAGLISAFNKTEFCANAHGAASEILAGGPEEMDKVFTEEKFQLLAGLCFILINNFVPSKVKKMVDVCFEAGWTKEDVHLTITLVCAFSMYNMYVDAIGNPGLKSKEAYQSLGQSLVSRGYFQAVISQR